MIDLDEQPLERMRSVHELAITTADVCPRPRTAPVSIVETQFDVVTPDANCTLRDDRTLADAPLADRLVISSSLASCAEC
ncbi:hypothetical protein [Natrinema hispanicum]|uniref:hypothetical protein n=1 Tax=Natrinema hispanicum TaxID=392421 RepID=UPI001A93992B|nr:hypothetical protein [Natrinema hispanicum]